MVLASERHHGTGSDVLAVMSLDGSYVAGVVIFCVVLLDVRVLLILSDFAVPL